MSDQWVNIQFNVSTKILGADIEFHDGSKLRLKEHQIEEKLFRDAVSGKTLNTSEMITFLLTKTGRTKQSLITPAAAAEALDKGLCIGKPSLNISFTPGSEIFVGDDVGRDIKHIIFDVEFTVRPKKNA